MVLAGGAGGIGAAVASLLLAEGASLIVSYRANRERAARWQDHATVVQANLARADFRGATFTAPIDFDGAFFFLTRIEGLDLSKSTGLSQWQLNMACGDARTELPSGLTRPEDWPCSEP